MKLIKFSKLFKQRYEEPQSFSIDHLSLAAGLYLREDHYELFNPHYRVWDLRFVAPREQRYIPPAVQHSIEHLFAYTLRKLLPGKYISFSPMGCQTGFTLITHHSITQEQLRIALITAISGILPLSCKYDIPALTPEACGQPRLFAIHATNQWLQEYLNILK